ncbi:hypothetical protein C0993_001876 [Termitomyces sp. T159_Od127]|nr:hypothetical protein C0993_001876 [Termitomyces sp. T159_Od127]
MAKEAADRENPDPEMTLEKYMRIRRDTIGARQLFDLGRWIYEIDVPCEVLTHPNIVKIEDLFVDLVSLANDLYSYKKEWFECDTNHNYITIAFRDPVTGLRKNDVQGAIDYTYCTFCQSLTYLENQKKVLPLYGESEDVQVAKYIEMVMDVVVGTIQWSLKCERYGHLDVAGAAKAPNWGEVTFNMDPF